MKTFVILTACVLTIIDVCSGWTVTAAYETTPPLPTAQVVTTAAAPTYPSIPNPYMQIELQSDMFSSYTMSISCLNSYSRQFSDTLKGQLQRAKQEMLANPNFCPGTTNADITTGYNNMVAVGSQVYLTFGVDIVSYGANTLDAMSSCAWQLGAYLSDFKNWRQPIWSDIFNCPKLDFMGTAFQQTDITWVC